MDPYARAMGERDINYTGKARVDAKEVSVLDRRSLLV